MRFYLPVLVLLAALGCGTVNPILKPIWACTKTQVTQADVDEALNDLVNRNWSDLAVEGGRLGWDALACILNEIETVHPDLKGNAAEFRKLHAAELKG